METYALVQRRLGMDAVRVLDRDMGAIVETLWIDPDIHRTAVGALLAAGRRDLSLADCASFESCAGRVSSEPSHSIRISPSRDSRCFRKASSKAGAAAPSPAGRPRYPPGNHAGPAARTCANTRRRHAAVVIVRIDRSRFERFIGCPSPDDR